MSPSSIFERQNSNDALLAARAFRRRYTVAGRWRALRLGLSLFLGSAGVLLALAVSAASDYVAAAAAAWIVLSRVLLTPNERRERRHGAVAQESFDSDVFALPWSPSVAGSKPPREDIRNWAHKEEEDGLRDWYSDTRPARHPVDVLICQRSTITWARQDHTTYAQVLTGAVWTALFATVVLGIGLNLSLGEYLLRLGLPVLPAALDVLDIARDNATIARKKMRLETEANSLLARTNATGIAPTVAECRDLQSGIFATRLLPGVPSWMYRLTQHKRQENMNDAVRVEVDKLPLALR